MKRRLFVGGAFAGLSTSRTFAASQKVKAGDIPIATFGKTGVKVSVIAQGGARMDLHPDVAIAAAHVRKVYDLGITYFDCARMYWGGRSEEAYGIGLQGLRKNVFLTTKSGRRTCCERSARRNACDTRSASPACMLPLAVRAPKGRWRTTSGPCGIPSR